MNAANDSSTSISVTWESIPEEHRRGVIIKYTVTITEADTGNVTTAEADGWNNSIKIDGLKKYTLYNVTVSASTSKGTSIESNVSQIRTDEDGKVIVNMVNTYHHYRYHRHHHHHYRHHHHYHHCRRHHHLSPSPSSSSSLSSSSSALSLSSSISLPLLSSSSSSSSSALSLSSSISLLLLSSSSSSSLSSL